MARQATDESRPLLSIVAVARDRDLTQDWLDRVLPQARQAEAEIILLGPGADRTQAGEKGLTVEKTAPELTPVLWTRGILQSRGEAVALTITDCLPASDWVSALVQALGEQPAAVAIGGTLDIAPGGGPSDWALCFLRYSA